jgi:uncharacterized SAM-binding protein YcdF (DUF218 family)
MKSKSKNRTTWLIAGLVLLAILVFHSAILGAMGDALVKDEPPRKADIGLVLAGDFSGNRVVLAGQLVNQGFVPKVLVSGPAGVYGVFECDLAIPFAENKGFPASYFVAFPHRAHSTQEEAGVVVPELRRLGAKTVLLVTSDYHTRRAGKIFRAAAPDLTFYVVGARDDDFSPHGWWRNREGRKVFAFESLKTVTEWFGL